MSDNQQDDYSQWMELSSLSSFHTQYGQGASLNDISLSDLYRYLQNPYNNIKEIQKASKYLTNKHGVIKEVLRALKSLPNLDYILSWSEVDDENKLKKYERKVHQFLTDIELNEFVRDGLYEVGQMGTIVACLRNKKYVQFLDLDDLRINRRRITNKGSHWVVEMDLKTVDTGKTVNDKLAIIESLPDEVTLARYNLYKSKGEDYRYVELKNCHVINIDSNRNFPFGLPITMGAWASLLQKEVINRVERSVADRLIKQMLILYAGTIDKEGAKPAPKELITYYHDQVSKLMQKKEGNNQRSHSNNVSGTGTVALPSFMKLETLDVNTEMFKKELYDKIDADIYMNLGVSSSLLYGGGSNYNSAQLNSQKFFRYAFTILEKFETLINSYISQILPKGVICTFKFSKATMLDRDKHIDQAKDFYMQTGGSKFWIEALTGLPYEDVIDHVKYEKDSLKTEDILSPPANAYTQSGKVDNKGGRPEIDNPTNENTNKTRSNGANNSPTPT